MHDEKCEFSIFFFQPKDELGEKFFIAVVGVQLNYDYAGQNGVRAVPAPAAATPTCGR